MDKFSWQEFFVGCASTFLLFFVVGIPLGALFAVTSGFLWMMGGTIWKGLRRFGVPIMICHNFSQISGFEWGYLLGAAAGIAILHIGDGFPDFRPTTADSGSWLGQKVRQIVIRVTDSTNEDEIMDIGGPLTKWIIPVIFQLSLIPYLVIR